VKRLFLVGCLLAVSFATTQAAAAPRFGVAEDATKYAQDGGASLFAQLRELGMTENRIVVRWNPNDPATIQEKPFLDRSILAAQRAGIRIVFSVYVTEAGGISADPDARIALFTAYLQKLARTYPSVSAFIVGKPVRSVSKLVKAGWTPRFELRGRLKPGWYVYAIRLQAATKSQPPADTRQRPVQSRPPAGEIGLTRTCVLASMPNTCSPAP
jgi:hypothetical protein